MHTTMQTLGRVAIIGGGVMVALVNVFLMRGVHLLPEAEKVAAYPRVYEYALIIPIVSVLGVFLARAIRRRDARRLAGLGHDDAAIDRMLDRQSAPPPVNWWILGGGLAFAVGQRRRRPGEVPGCGRRSCSPSRWRSSLFMMVSWCASSIAGGAQHAGRHRAGDLRVPRHARARRRARRGG